MPNGKLHYECKYLNGLKNGKGREYYNDKIIFEGEYKNGQKWCGKFYNLMNNEYYEIKEGNGYIKKFHESHLNFEGYIKNGKENGKGKYYDYNNGRLIYDGEYLNGKWHGRGIRYDYNGTKFDGIYLYDHKLKGKEYINGRLEYEGEYLFNKKWNGKGYDENGNIIYELKNGNGKFKDYDEYGKLYFEGEYLNGKLNGRGKEYNNEK